MTWCAKLAYQDAEGADNSDLTEFADWVLTS